MTFFTETMIGRRCQAEEALADLQRIYRDETDPLIRAHLLEAGQRVETVVALLKGKEQGDG